MRSVLDAIIVPVFAGCVALAATACDPRVNLGAIGDGGASVLWRATFEPGNLSEWTSDGQGGTQAVNSPAAPTVTMAVVHNGRYAGVSTLEPALGMDSLNYFYRRQPSPPEAYYSAWFYIPSGFTVGSWLSLHHFRSSASVDGSNPVATWDLNLITVPGIGLVAQLFDFGTAFNLSQVNPMPVPRDTWVHFEVLFRKAIDPTGRVAVWQDGVLILDRRAVVTARSSWNEWTAGAATDDITPFPAVVYMDDAAISLTRLGNIGN
jgi:hypothetical protein